MLDTHPKILVYFYPGWVRSRQFDEWEVVASGISGFEGHWQPRKPLRRYYLDKVEVMEDHIEKAIKHGIDGFIFCWYWDNGAIHFPEALSAFMSICKRYPNFSYGLMWANRSPHQSLPISVIDIDGDFYRAFSERIVTTNSQDILNMMEYCHQIHFQNSNYLHFEGKPFFAVFSMRDLFCSIGEPSNLPNDHLKNLFGNTVSLTAVSHGMEYWLEDAKRLGISQLTSYVLLPDWHGPDIQDYVRYSNRAALLWNIMETLSELTFIPAVTVGWDASSRGAEPVNEGKKTYPWYPIVVNSSPKVFGVHLQKGLDFSFSRNLPAVLIASWNEWSEGHYLEPDSRYGTEWLEALNSAKISSWRRNNERYKLR